ncbi:hypothetical protein IFM89_037521 [Coptis chinensis]|uniref:Neprosin PEP catalytic domain-containing protein n=1 Tax=Coptis chinensis TaxID=261450 RepID=A0A835I070_9MAGN|nr:hypothetical protein IFM89_037521 [Coptis chinensis]
MASIALLVVLFLCLSYYGVGGRMLAEEDDLELEEQLKILNKPPRKTIETKYGDIFDCVDIERQPAFDNPLLNNHKIRMRPTSSPKVMIHGTTSAHGQSRTMLKGIGACPQGTVPIRRTRREDLVRAKSFLRSHRAAYEPHIPGQFRALLRLGRTEMAIKHFGAGGHINVQNPPVGPEQYSAALIWVESSPEPDLNAIHAGWQVSYELYNDSRTRLFTYWEGNGPNNKGCYHHLCPGFVQIDKAHPIGQVIEPISKYGGDQQELKLAIYQDPDTKDWWLLNTGLNIHYGYWPKALFPSLEGGAVQVAWGGLVKAGENKTNPPMGSGHFDGNFGHTCYFKECQVFDEEGTPHDADISFTVKLADNSECYDVNSNYITEENGYSFFFGGAGGHCGE